MALWIVFAVVLGLALIWLTRALVKIKEPLDGVGRENAGLVAMPMRARKAWVVAVCACVMTSVLALYLLLGSPQTASKPYSEAAQHLTAGSDLMALVSAAENKLLKNPEDVSGWSALAPAYAALGRFAEAEHAYKQALRLAPQSAELFAGYGQMLMTQSNGIVSAKAQSLLQRAHELDATLIMPRYYLGLARVQDNDKAGGLQIWEALLAEISAQQTTGAPFRHMLQRKIEDLRQG